MAKQIAQSCENATLVLTDCAAPFDIKLHQALKNKHFAYYDNPEPFVPGDYSACAAEVMEIAEAVFFANENLAQEPIYSAPKPAAVEDRNLRTRF